MGDNCLCGLCSLGSGTFVIGILEIIESFIKFSISSITLLIFILHHINNNAVNAAESDPFDFVLIGLSSFVVFLSIVDFFLSLRLCKAHRKENPEYVKPWLYWNYLCLSIFILISLCTTVLFAIKLQYSIPLIFISVVIVGVLIESFCINIVRKYAMDFEITDGPLIMDALPHQSHSTYVFPNSNN